MQVTDQAVVFDPEDYDHPPSFAKIFRLRGVKKPIEVTFDQMRFLGSIGATWAEAERFFGVDQTTLKSHFHDAFERGKTETNIKLRNKLIEMGLAGSVPVLIYVSKNRLGMSDNGPTYKEELADSGKLDVTLKVLKNERTQELAEADRVA